MRTTDDFTAASSPGPQGLPVDPTFLRETVEEYYRERVQKTWSGGHIQRGRLPKPGDIQLRTNDYLSIAHDSRIIRGEIAALEEVGHGDAISRVFVYRRHDAIGEFERRIARHMGAEDAVLCMSGYCANTGLIQAVAQPETPVYIDLKAHASLWEGIVLARATARPFRHNDPGHLERQVRQHGPGLVVVDALYSTSGSLCPLPDIVVVAEGHGCALVVDETHSFGVQGPRGAGVTAAFGLEHKVHFRTIGLSKAVASRGGVVVCSARNAEFFRYEAFPMMFSTSVLAHEVAGFDAALDIIEGEPWRRERVGTNHAYLRAGLDDLGYNVDDSDAQIIALEAGPEPEVMRLRDALEERGVFGSVFCAPATPRNRALVRFNVNASLTRGALDQVLRVCSDIRGLVGMSEWASTRRRKEWARLCHAAE